MEAVYLLTGSNLGDRLDNLKKAKEYIEQACGRIITYSSIYQTAAWGKTDQPDFLNQVIELRTALNPEELLRSVLSIEKELGRVRKEKWGERIIDIDILYFGSRIVQSDTLLLPHPSIAQRRFVLAPLCEIAPGFVHPVVNKSNEQLLLICKDILPVKKLS